MTFDKILGNPVQSSGINLIDNVVKQKHIQSINIWYYKGNYDYISFTGTVKFKNNAGTELTQEFKGNSLSDVFMKVQNFCLSIE